MTSQRFDSSVSLWTFFLEAYLPLKLRGASEKTSRQYQIQIGHFSRHLGREATLADLDDDVLSVFLWQRAQATSKANSNKCRNHLLALWRFAARKRYVEHFPDVPKLPEPKRTPQAWTMEQINRLFAACASYEQPIGRYHGADWMTALHWFLWNTGERIGAVLAVERSHVDLAAGTVRIPAEIRKGQRADAFYRLWPETVAALKRIWSDAPGRAFPFPKHKATLYNRYRKLLISAGLPTGRFCGPHRMRKSFASHLKAMGGDATKALGHSDPSVTEGSYIDPGIVSDASDKIDLLPRPKMPPDAA